MTNYPNPDKTTPYHQLQREIKLGQDPFTLPDLEFNLYVALDLGGQATHCLDQGGRTDRGQLLSRRRLKLQTFKLSRPASS